MAKYNYFDTLDTLADYAYSSVEQACTDSNIGSKKDFEKIRSECNNTLFSLENSLFSEFLPPLERDNIAAYAHCLSRVVDIAAEHFIISRINSARRSRTEEERICSALMQEIKNGTAMLRNLKRPDEIPDIQKFRALLHSGLEVHNAELAKMNSGAFTKQYADTVISAGRLRRELSRCFDKLLEIMLNNI